ncbi:DUF789 family protein [Quillaja saponaria]|uniref:DUF789 family protein n=1 Tax=Quillaja saponaria TaxID=32244 RepID=A0AAD7PX13_QUISA|nr:DUF789 family protein [Quillaja saponaria]
MNKQNIESMDSSLPKSCDSFDQAMPEEQSQLYVPHLLADKIGQTQRKASFTDLKQSQNSGSTLQKWIPVSIKDLGSAISRRSISSSLEHSGETTAKDWTLKSTVEGKKFTSFQNLGSSLNSRETSTGQISRKTNCSHGDENQSERSWNQDVSTLKGLRGNYTAANCLIDECEIEVAFLNDSDKIERAVNDACRAQLACDAVQMITGIPIAEFERLLRFLSPAICQSPNLRNCLTCSGDHTNGLPLCRYETPKVSLGCLWEWYEKHGSYGLEIRAEDHENPKRLGVDRFGFRAYFVPFLSAIQLFGKRKSHSLHNSDKSPGLGSGPCEISDTSEKSSKASRIPIFPILFPLPRLQGEGIYPPPEQMCHSKEAFASAMDSASVQSVDTTCSAELELLFEYFESEQPQRRRPLHEKYSVAWYPIYRIPDGNFRAAFLTYHSLGHWIRRSTKIDYPSVDASIISPVVGLQSYNAQEECWFQLRHSVLPDTAKLSGLSSSGILKERLRTLEETATLMSRAVVNKGNLIFANRHPDYEFFLSRRRL